MVALKTERNVIYEGVTVSTFGSASRHVLSAVCVVFLFLSHPTAQHLATRIRQCMSLFSLFFHSFTLVFEFFRNILSAFSNNHRSAVINLLGLPGFWLVLPTCLYFRILIVFALFPLYSFFCSSSVKKRITSN